MFDEIWNGDPIRLLGVRTTRLVDRGAPVQLNIFDFQKSMEEEKKSREKERKKKSLEDALSSIKKRYGEDAIQKGM